MNRKDPLRQGDSSGGVPASNATSIVVLTALLLPLLALAGACRSQPKVVDTQTSLDGWIAFPSPREGHGPGTILRIDADGIGHRLTRLPESRLINTTEEWNATPTVVGSIESLLDFLATGTADSRRRNDDTLPLAATTEYRLHLRDPVVRTRIEPNDEESISEALADLFGTADFRPIPGNRYYLIRETRSVRALGTAVEADTAERLGGRAGIAAFAGVPYTDVTEEEDGTLRVNQSWVEPHHVLFRADRIHFGEELPGLSEMTSLSWTEVERWPLCHEIAVTLHTTLDDRDSHNGVELSLLERGTTIQSRTPRMVRWAPGDSNTFVFTIDPPVLLPKLAEMGVRLIYDVEPNFDDDRWQVSVEASGTLDDNSRMTLLPRTSSMEMGVGIATHWERGFEITTRPLYRNSEMPMLSSVDITMTTTTEKTRENDVKLSLLLQGRTLDSALVRDEHWEQGDQRTFRFYLEPPVPYLGLSQMDMGVDVHLIVPSVTSRDRWRMTIEAEGTLTGGDRVPLLRRGKPEKFGGTAPKIRRWEFR